jgi:hypothetical protein
LGEHVRSRYHIGRLRGEIPREPLLDLHRPLLAHFALAEARDRLKRLPLLQVKASWFSDLRVAVIDAAARPNHRICRADGWGT